MSPILTRPVREQFEHDRVIRLLQARYRRKHEVAMNPGGERNQSIMSGDLAVYPDLVLFANERNKRLEGTVEVETGESVNYLEALSEWVPFSKLRAPFYLYVPPHVLDSARRLCAEHKIAVAEIWTYHLAFDQVRFNMVHRDEQAAKLKRSTRMIIDKAPEPVEPEPEAAADGPSQADRLAVMARIAKAAKAVKARKARKTTPAKPVAKAARAGKAVKAPAKPAAKTTKSAKATKPAKAAKTPKPVKPVKAAKAKKPASIAKTTKTARTARAAPAKAAKARKAVKAATKARTASKSARTKQPVKAGKSGAAARRR